jgi:glutaredoxin-like protein NrdH
MNNKPKLYALSTCIHCRNTKRFLDENNIDYDCIYVDQLQGEEREEIVNEIKKLNPAVSFPTLLIGKKVIIGFNKDKISDLLEI